MQMVELVTKEEFAVTAFNLDNKAFVVYVASFTSSDPIVHPFRQA